MNQTKKRLSIIELAISITDIETIKLQMAHLAPLRTDDKIDEILSLLENDNYAHAQNIIPIYIEEVHDTVIQRIPELEEIQETEDQSIINEYDFLSESSDEELEDNSENEIKSEKDDNQEIEHNIEYEEIIPLEIDTTVKTQFNDYTTLLDINPDKILAQNISLDLQNKTKDPLIKKKIDFNLDTVPKDNFFDNEIEVSKESIDTQVLINETREEETEKETHTKEEEQTTENKMDIAHVEDVKEPILNVVKDTETITKTKDTFYPAIPDIYPIFQDIQIKYPSLYQTDSYSDMLEIWLEKIADEGYSEAEVEEILLHIEKLALEKKAEAAQFLLVTSRTESKYAKFILARALYRGNLLQRNLEESFKIMSYLAFDEKYPEALCDLGQFYENGISIEKDKLQAELLYKEAMDLGIQRAKNHYERIQKESQGFFSFLKR